MSASILKPLVTPSARLYFDLLAELDQRRQYLTSHPGIEVKEAFHKQLKVPLDLFLLLLFITFVRRRDVLD